MADAGEKSDGRELFERRVRALEALGHRGSATSNEREAAEAMARELRELGLEVAVEEFEADGADALGRRLLVHVATAAAGLAAITVSPALTIGLGATALISLVGETSTRWRGLSRLLGQRRSCNVVARFGPGPSQEQRRRVVVVAHLDTQRTGLMWRGGLVERMSALLRWVPGPLKSPTFPVVASLAIQPALGVAWLIAPAARPLVGLAAALGFVDLVAAGLLADWARGPFVPGAADNATGVAASLELAARWLREPQEGVELVVVLTGCEETGALGAAAWLDAHASELRDTPTAFLNLDTFAFGAPRFVDSEHTLAAETLRYPADLVSMTASVARRLGLADAGPFDLPTFTDAIAFLTRGVPGVSLLAFGDDFSMPYYHQMSDTSDHVDFDVAWRCVELAWEVLREMARA
jgi:hypothetical protein